MKKYWLPVLLLLFLTGCKSTRTAIRTQFTADSVWIKETVRDTIIAIAPDSATIQALIECDSLGQAHLKELLRYKAGAHAKPPKIHLEKNILTAKSITDSASIRLQIKDKSEKRTYTETDKEVQVIEVNKLTRWQKFWMRAGQLSVLILLITGIFKLRRIVK